MCKDKETEQPQGIFIHGAGIGAMHSQQANEAKAMLGGRAALRTRARVLRDEADSLEALARSIPDEITPAADQALIRLAYGGR